MKGLNAGMLIAAYLIGLLVVVIGVIAVAKPSVFEGIADSFEAEEQQQPTATTQAAVPTQTTVPAVPSPAAETCFDGTVLGSCSTANNGTKCEKVGGENSLAEKCGECGCPQGKNCNKATDSCFAGCRDGTPYFECNYDRWYCNSTALYDLNGSECGCPDGYQQVSYPFGPHTRNQCTRTCRPEYDPECMDPNK